jgi:hypothetical protein
MYRWRKQVIEPDPYDYWVNNPLITPINKTFMYEDDMERMFNKGVTSERERILGQWQYEMTKCKCDDAMGHMERRIKAELPKGLAK